MVLWFGTKKNVNGHRRYLGLSTELKQYTNQPSGWMTRTDFAEVKAKDLERIRKELMDSGYTFVASM